MDVLLLAGYVLLLALAYARARSVAWLTITLAGGFAVFGAGINFALDRGHQFTRVELQVLLLVLLAAVVLVAWVPRLGLAATANGTLLGAGDLGFRRQVVAIWLPVILLLAVLFLVTNVWTEGPAFLRPVSFLMGRAVAEDNAEWLDYASQWASGDPINQAVAMGGPLQLLMTLFGTIMASISLVTLGGFNEVAVAANTVVLGQMLMVVLVLFAFAPLVESRFRGSRLPAPLIWIGMVVLCSATLAVTNNGHLTLQFTFLSLGLWSATFLSALRMRRARLFTSLAAAATMTVWLPVAAVTIVVIAGWLVVLISRGIRHGWRNLDPLGLSLLVVVALGILQPLWSGISFTLGVNSAYSESGSGGVRTVSTIVPIGAADSTLFAATGGTEQAGPLLALVAVVAVLAAGIFLAPIAGPLPTSLLRRFIPIGIVAAVAVAIYGADFWVTGAGPNYGSMKFAFMAVIVGLATSVPLALALLDVRAGAHMGQLRWLGVGGVLLLLMIDSLLPRAIALGRPEQWSPPIPFNNTSGSYWYPAEVNGLADQPIESNPIACLYLPEGSPVPTAIVPSGLSDPQRVYACSRQLVGLGGLDAQAQSVVDWLRREWFTNTPAWSDVYDSLAGLPPEVLDRRVIILDDGSNVKGVETLRSLLARYPKDAARTG